MNLVLSRLERLSGVGIGVAGAVAGKGGMSGAWYMRGGGYSSALFYPAANTPWIVSFEANTPTKVCPASSLLSRSLPLRRSGGQISEPRRGFKVTVRVM